MIVTAARQTRRCNRLPYLELQLTNDNPTGPSLPAAERWTKPKPVPVVCEHTVVSKSSQILILCMPDAAELLRGTNRRRDENENCTLCLRAIKGEDRKPPAAARF